MAVELDIDRRASDDLLVLMKRLKALGDGKTIPAAFRKALRSAAQPAARKAKVAARALPSNAGTGVKRKDGRPPLRRQIANATAVQVKLGGKEARVSIRVSKRSLGDRKDLPRLLNKGEWKHPVFGRDDVEEVEQTGKKDWYDQIMRDSAPDVKAAILREADEFEKRLMR